MHGVAIAPVLVAVAFGSCLMQFRRLSSLRPVGAERVRHFYVIATEDGAPILVEWKHQEHTVKAGINYRFNTMAPVVAKY